MAAANPTAATSIVPLERFTLLFPNDPVRAQKATLAHLEFRKQNKFDQMDHSIEPSEPQLTSAVQYKRCGSFLDGSEFCIVQTGKINYHVLGELKELFCRFHFLYMEHMLALGKKRNKECFTNVAICDMRGYSIFHPSLYNYRIQGIMRQIAEVGEANYPYVTTTIYFVNCDISISLVWLILSPLISYTIRDRIVFVRDPVATFRPLVDDATLQVILKQIAS
jgi:hypothetical protein